MIHYCTRVRVDVILVLLASPSDSRDNKLQLKSILIGSFILSLMKDFHKMIRSVYDGLGMYMLRSKKPKNIRKLQKNNTKKR